MSVSIEFISLVSISLILVFFIIFYNSYYIVFVDDQRKLKEVEDLAKTLSSEINLAVKAGSGYEREFFLIKPSVNFTLKIENYFVEVKYKDHAFEEPIMVNNVTGHFKFNKINKIKNINEKIYVE